MTWLEMIKCIRIVSSIFRFILSLRAFWKNSNICWLLGRNIGFFPEKVKKYLSFVFWQCAVTKPLGQQQTQRILKNNTRNPQRIWPGFLVNRSLIFLQMQGVQKWMRLRQGSFWTPTNKLPCLGCVGWVLNTPPLSEMHLISHRRTTMLSCIVPGTVSEV